MLTRSARGSIVRATSYKTTQLLSKPFLLTTLWMSTQPTTSEIEPREQMNYDVVSVGGGPAGLAMAIKLKQLAKASNQEISVCIIDKGGALGSHIISGNVFEPRALTELFPNWKDLPNVPLQTPASSDEFLVLAERRSISIPHFLLPKQLNNDGNYVISLSQLVRWLGEQAEQLGVEIYPGFAADEVLYSEDGTTVRGVATKDAGISKNGAHKDNYTRGIELIGRQTIFAEGCRGSCSEELISKYKLREGRDEQSYGLGIKEVWRIPAGKLRPGHIQHTVGWPLDTHTFGGTFLYHQLPDLVHLGMVVGLDYKNPYLNPYKEFQRWKTHPIISDVLDGGVCISYGARCLNEGGFHAIPRLSFPGGLLVGCSAGFLNAVKIKGSHTAMKSGMLAAEAIFNKINSAFKNVKTPASSSHVSIPSSSSNNCNENLESALDSLTGAELTEYEPAVMQSWIGDELKVVRNTHASFKYGLFQGMIHSFISCFITHGNEPWTIRNTTRDSQRTQPASQHRPIDYPKPDGKLTFDLLSNLQRSGTNHDHDQPSHLRLKPSCSKIPTEVSLPIYDGPEQRFCPAGVYEYTDDPNDVTKKTLTINAQNCVHCKCCSIKTPGEFIKWTVPEGGGGPAYTVM